MKPTRKLTRRSFLGRVAGGVAAGAALIAVGTPEAEALQVSDNDTGRGADPYGRGYTGYSDSDSGRGADRVNHGRRGRRGNRTTYRPCRRRTGYSDSDGGRGADRPGCGRRGRY